MAHLIGSSARSCLRPHESTSLRGQAWRFRETSLNKNDGCRQNRAQGALSRLLSSAAKTFDELKLWTGITGPKVKTSPVANQWAIEIADLRETRQRRQ